ncbi:MAG: alpha/beta hydrolase [Bacilli bacterium]|nr:alpha/beta hydrolase [Bacilli bacterium]
MKDKKNILLLHGWNYRNYTSQTSETDAWHNRSELVSELEKEFNVYKLNFPGFCGSPEPDKSWTLDNYAEFVSNHIKSLNVDIDYILGYSFGGAVAIRYKTNFKGKENLILVSPAIIRTSNKSKKFAKTPKIFDGIRSFLRDLYIIHVVKTNEMVYGTKFLRKSYQSIAREDLKDEVKLLPKDEFVIIYGSDDEQVSPKKVMEYLGNTYEKNIEVVPGGKHNIGVTHSGETMKLIKSYVKK